MTHRAEILQSVVAAAAAAFKLCARGAESQRTVEQAFSALNQIGEPRSLSGCRLPVCSYLNAALNLETRDAALRSLIQHFVAIEPFLTWQRRPTYDASTASGNFVEGHANAMIVGPGGLEDRRDVWLGVSLLAPVVRYPDHSHPPEEVYLVMSDGEFRQEEGAWFAPGIGGSFYNRPRIKHAMRSLGTPLFAFWVLHLPVY
jgi:hypothetical protein